MAEKNPGEKKKVVDTRIYLRGQYERFYKFRDDFNNGRKTSKPLLSHEVIKLLLDSYEVHREPTACTMPATRTSSSTATFSEPRPMAIGKATIPLAIQHDTYHHKEDDRGPAFLSASIETNVPSLAQRLVEHIKHEVNGVGNSSPEKIYKSQISFSIPQVENHCLTCCCKRVTNNATISTSVTKDSPTAKVTQSFTQGVRNTTQSAVQNIEPITKLYSPSGQEQENYLSIKLETESVDSDDQDMEDEDFSNNCDDANESKSDFNLESDSGSDEQKTNGENQNNTKLSDPDPDYNPSDDYDSELDSEDESVKGDNDNASVRNSWRTDVLAMIKVVKSPEFSLDQLAPAKKTETPGSLCEKYGASTMECDAKASSDRKEHSDSFENNNMNSLCESISGEIALPDKVREQNFSVNLQTDVSMKNSTNNQFELSNDSSLNKDTKETIENGFQKAETPSGIISEESMERILGIDLERSEIKGGNNNVLHYQCKECGKMKTQLQAIYSHACAHINSKPSTCSVCGKVLKRGLDRHMKSMHQSVGQSYVCTFENCGNISKTKWDLLQHKQTHNRKKKKSVHKDTYQSAVDQFEKEIQGIIDIVRPPKRWGVGRRLYLKQEMMTGKIESKSVSVVVDNKNVDYSATLSEPIEEEASQSETDALYQCKQCDKKFGLWSVAKHHAFTHIRTNNVCHICGNILKNKRYLQKHIREMHCPVKQLYKCRFKNCSYAAKTRSKVNRHALAHKDCRSHVCETCGKAFKRGCHLNVHSRIHLDVSPILCFVCGYRCRQKASLNWHMKTKHPDCNNASE